MSLLSLVLMTEAIAGPGSFDRALDAPDWMLHEFDRIDDRESGADGGRMCIDELSATIALHSMLAPRSAFCLRRACRRAP